MSGGMEKYYEDDEVKTIPEATEEIPGTETYGVQGVKYDAGKPMFSLLEETFAKELLDIAKALTYGAKKYSPDNWKKVELVRYKDALGRHLNSWRQGEKCDPESGMQHLTHAMVNMLFIQWLENNVKDVK